MSMKFETLGSTPWQRRGAQISLGGEALTTALA